MGISITFNDIDADLANKMISFYEQCVGVDAPVTVTPAEPTASSNAVPIPMFPTTPPPMSQPPVPTTQPPVPTTQPPISQDAAPATVEHDDEELDAFGIPFNPNFHSETRAKTKKGSWRMRRGVDKKAAQQWTNGIVNGMVTTIEEGMQSAPTAEIVPMEDCEVDYETELFPLWKALHAINCLPSGHIQMIMEQHGFRDDYPAIVKEAGLRSAIYIRLKEVLDQLSDTQRQHVAHILAQPA